MNHTDYRQKQIRPCGLGWAICNGMCDNCSYVKGATTSSTDYNYTDDTRTEYLMKCLIDEDE